MGVVIHEYSQLLACVDLTFPIHRFLWKTVTHCEQESVEVFKWTGKNDYVSMCEGTFISFGGGEGKYGLYLDANLIDGSIVTRSHRWLKPRCHYLFFIFLFSFCIA
ncbi:hypothetical protein JB92DRAFT_2691114 [Gautieria morchelliformis]|nr:hypothetical protein JB92DRAFT_2691114 [Gautieria morchelliformis]